MKKPFFYLDYLCFEDNNWCSLERAKQFQKLTIGNENVNDDGQSFWSFERQKLRQFLKALEKYSLNIITNERRISRKEIEALFIFFDSLVIYESQMITYPMLQVFFKENSLLEIRQSAHCFTVFLDGISLGHYFNSNQAIAHYATLFNTFNNQHQKLSINKSYPYLSSRIQKHNRYKIFEIGDLVVVDHDIAIVIGSIDDLKQTLRIDLFGTAEYDQIKRFATADDLHTLTITPFLKSYL